jgi:hypothetical protein
MAIGSPGFAASQQDTVGFPGQIIIPGPDPSAV